MAPELALSFDDIMLYPQQGVVASRKDIDTTTKIGKFILNLPVFSAPMETVTDFAMASAMAAQGAVGVMHRFGDYETSVRWVRALRALNYGVPIAIAIGVRDGRERIDADILVLDVAHADTKDILLYVGAVKRSYPDKILVAGSVATRHGARRLANAGADVLRVGIGGGAACITREVTGFGVPMVTSIQECVVEADIAGIKVMADGGIKNTGDIVKALAVGADYIMMGRMFAGTSESPLGNEYFGQASSKSAAHDGHHIQGESGTVESQGKVKDVLDSIDDALRSGISYGGGRSISEFQDIVMFNLVSPLSMKETGVRI